MRHKILGQPLLPLGKNNQGFIMIITVIIITAIICIIIIKTSLSTLSQLESTDISLQGLRAQYYIEGCLQEALIHLNRDNAYTGEILNLGTGSCDISISGIDNNRTISITGNLNNYYHSLNVDVTLEPFSIVIWDN